jgi:hypothetical protein
MEAAERQTAEETPSGFKPPYFSFQTFWSFIEQLAEKPLPPQIDRSLLSSKSGTDQANLLMALRSFDLIDDDQRVRPLLVQLTSQDEATRLQLLGQILLALYPAQMELARSNGTEAQLHESFASVFGIRSADTRRKAVTFYLHAAKAAGLPLSPHFPQTRAGSGANGARVRRSPVRPRRASAASQAQATVDAPQSQPAAELHPFLQGLLQELPTAGATWTSDQRDRWLEMAKLTVDMLFPVGSE